MSEILEQYQPLIEQMIPVISAPDFDAMFKTMTAEISKPHQFQLKMEINRLKQPCNRFIDLRGHVDGDVQPYDHDGKVHYMDAKAREVFEAQIGHYGSFTMGVFEKVNATENNYRVMHKKEQQERLKEKEQEEKRKEEQRKKRSPLAAVAAPEPEEDDDLFQISYNARKVQFQSYAIRSEERMNYSISLEVLLPDGDTIKATSSDLSVSGCKIKIAADVTTSAGLLLRVRFKGLEEEFALGVDKGIEYEVVANEFVESAQYVRMKRTYSDKTPGFDEFLGNFINGNKRRYKVNMENTEEAVIIKGYEQYYIPRITTLPLFFSLREERYQLTSILTTENNKPVFRYWRNEQQQVILGQVFGHKRVSRMLEHGEDTLIYSFTHSSKGKLHHYAAVKEELDKDATLRQLFFGFGARKPSWRVHKIQLLRASWDHAHIPLSLPDSAGEEIRQLNRPPSARVEGVVKDTRLVIALTDITEVKKTKQYLAYKFDIKQANDLKIFGVRPVTDPPFVHVVAVDYVNLRKETRFLYQTPVLIDSETESKLEGTTRDFSTKGMQMEIAQPSGIEKGEIIQLALPEMQKITRSYKLAKLPYEVMAISKNQRVINVRIHEEKDEHIGRKFFQQLIRTNRSKLTAAEEGQSIPGLSTAMRNMFVHACANLPFYIHRKGVRYMINVVGHGGKANSLHQLMEKFKVPPSDYHLEPLTKGNLVEVLFAEILKNMKRQDAPEIRELYVRVDRNKKQVQDAIIMEYTGELDTDHNHKQFIKDAVQNDLFFGYKIYLSRTGRPDVDYIAKELKYVGNYAIHRAKVLEEELWGVIGVGDAIDITQELMTRYGFSTTDWQIQQQARRFYFGA